MATFLCKFHFPFIIHSIIYLYLAVLSRYDQNAECVIAIASKAASQWKIFYDFTLESVVYVVCEFLWLDVLQSSEKGNNNQNCAIYKYNTIICD